MCFCVRACAHEGRCLLRSKVSDPLGVGITEGRKLPSVDAGN